MTKWQPGMVTEKSLSCGPVQSTQFKNINQNASDTATKPTFVRNF